MIQRRAYLLKRLVALVCCLGIAYVAFDELGNERPKLAQPTSDLPSNTNQTNATGIDSVEVNREVTTSETNNLQPNQILDGLKAGNVQAVKEYKSYSQWCYLENMHAKTPDVLCDKVAIAQNDAIFQQQAERLAIAGDASSQLALGLWWQEKTMQTLANYNISAKNDNLVKQFDFENPTNNTDHLAYLAGANLRKQALEAQRWLISLAASQPEANDALESLRFQALLP